MRQPGTRLWGGGDQTNRQIPAGSCVGFAILSQTVCLPARWQLERNLVSPYQALELSSATRNLIMIDDPCKTEQLLSSLEAALPLESRIGPQLAAVLHVACIHQDRTLRDAVLEGLSDLRQRDLGLGLKRNILRHSRFRPPCPIVGPLLG